MHGGRVFCDFWMVWFQWPNSPNTSGPDLSPSFCSYQKCWVPVTLTFNGSFISWVCSLKSNNQSWRQSLKNLPLAVGADNLRRNIFVAVKCWLLCKDAVESQWRWEKKKKVMEGTTKFSWEQKIHYMGPLHPDISKMCELEHWLHLAWRQHLFWLVGSPGFITAVCN